MLCVLVIAYFIGAAHTRCTCYNSSLSRNVVHTDFRRALCFVRNYFNYRVYSVMVRQDRRFGCSVEGRRQLLFVFRITESHCQRLGGSHSWSHICRLRGRHWPITMRSSHKPSLTAAHCFYSKDRPSGLQRYPSTIRL
jgi:hypothetical protein